jgi:hypothetical protein
MSKSTPTFTTTPDPVPPELRCPVCHVLLTYRATVVNDDQPPERWDYFDCATCGRFEYGHRMRQLRHGRD